MNGNEVRTKFGITRMALATSLYGGDLLEKEKARQYAKHLERVNGAPTVYREWFSEDGTLFGEFRSIVRAGDVA